MWTQAKVSSIAIYYYSSNGFKEIAQETSDQIKLSQATCNLNILGHIRKKVNQPKFVQIKVLVSAVMTRNKNIFKSHDKNSECQTLGVVTGNYTSHMVKHWTTHSGYLYINNL